MIKLKTLLIITGICLFIVVATAQANLTHTQPIPAPVPPNVAQVFNLVNAERVRHGLPALVLDSSVIMTL